VEESGRTRVARVIGDRAYDSSGVYGLLGERGIEVVVKPKVNARVIGVTRLGVGSLSRLGVSVTMVGLRRWVWA